MSHSIKLQKMILKPLSILEVIIREAYFTNFLIIALLEKDEENSMILDIGILHAVELLMNNRFLRRLKLDHKV